ncbi:sensor domain-containing diguanylate cyclase [Methyloradius palustris]|nr:diguanylate cyclase [Methyloradius palustris]
MKSFEQVPRPGLLSYILLPLAFCLSAKVSLALATSQEGVTILWLPNAFTLATLLYYRGQRYWLFMLLVMLSEIAGDFPRFPWHESIILGVANIIEVTIAYLIMRESGVSRKLNDLRDVVQFSVAGPLIGSLFGGLIGAAIIKYFDATTDNYLSIVQVWWFGDALGLMILTPMLLAFLYPKKQIIQPFQRVDLIVFIISAGLAGLIFSASNAKVWGVFITPTLLLPSMLYLAARTNLKWTAIGICIVSFSIALLISHGEKPFGDLPMALTILHEQEFIFTLSIASMGLATLMAHIRDHKHNLEIRVAERTEALKAVNRQLEELSATDSLTGIANRRRFDEQLQSEWSRAIRSSQPLSLAIIDIDWFKNYNDHYGHQEGDECLRRVAGILSSVISRGSDLLARYGGEEFVIIAPNTDATQAYAIGQKICDAFQVAGLLHALSSYGYVTVSIGVASMIPENTLKPSTLVKAADEALYMAKGQGRNQVVAAEY